MKKLRRLCIAAVFTLVITTATLAGDISTPGIAQPPPQTLNESSTTTFGDIHTGGIQAPQAMGDSVTGIALNLLQTMLSMF